MQMLVCLWILMALETSTPCLNCILGWLLRVPPFPSEVYMSFVTCYWFQWVIDPRQSASPFAPANLHAWSTLSIMMVIMTNHGLQPLSPPVYHHPLRFRSPLCSTSPEKWCGFGIWAARSGRWTAEATNQPLHLKGRGPPHDGLKTGCHFLFKMGSGNPIVTSSIYSKKNLNFFNLSVTDYIQPVEKGFNSHFKVLSCWVAVSSQISRLVSPVDIQLLVLPNDQYQKKQVWLCDT